jgi:lysozyme
MNTSAAGRKMIEGFEGCRLEAYQDIVGVWTIGYGDTGPDVGPDIVWTQEQCDSALTNRLQNEFEPAVNAAGPASQQQFDAMVCLAYNIGAGGFAGSTVAREHAAGNYNAAADAFLMWDKAGGEVCEPLLHRRQAERQVYLGGAYP